MAKSKNIKKVKISKEEKEYLLITPWKKTLPISKELDSWLNKSMDANVRI